MVEDVATIETALSIPIASADHLIAEDFRRLTGPNLLWDRAGAVLDVFFTGLDPLHVIALWRRQSRRVLDAVGWTDEQMIERQFEGGVNLAISAPMDQLYSAIFVAQTAWHFCAGELLDERCADFEKMITDLKSVMAREANARLITLIDAAQEHGVDVLSDDDELSLGHGTGSQTWPVTKLPSPDDVEWDKLHNVPVALITGTNGKTTTTRLCSAIARAGGMVAGLTSTEFVRVGDDVLDRGDYSGPGGGRMLLRDKRLEIAHLEVARGGILRRGLPVRQATVALVLNVAADHLGQYGVNTVAELAEAKFAVHRALADNGILVLNADDAFVVAEASRTKATIWWISLDPKSPQIDTARSAAVPCAWLEGDVLVFFNGRKETPVIGVENIPITMAGAARYNILNALGAVCISRAMGIDNDAIHAGLSRFHSSPTDNPGRCNEFSVKGARVFVDFAHNPHSIAAVTSAMATIPARRRFVLLSHAGDRSDQDIRDVTTSAFALNPDYVFAAELANYLRGRALGEITGLIRDTAIEQGMKPECIFVVPSPTFGVEKIIDMLEPSDLALLLVLSEREEVFKILGQ